MSDLSQATDDELTAELSRRGSMPRCRCGKWQTYVGACNHDDDLAEAMGAVRSGDLDKANAILRPMAVYLHSPEGI